MRKIIYILFVALIIIPTLIIAFILGGIDAVAGYELCAKFYSFMERILRKVDNE
jgi:hypothetical protein